MKSVLIFFFVCGTLYCQPNKNTFFNFKKADSIAQLYPGNSIKNLPVLVYQLTRSLANDTEKFRAIYTWVSTHLKNDYNAYKKTTEKRKKWAHANDKFKTWNQNYLPKMYKNLVKHQKTACTGYAYLIQQMAALANLECVIVDGYTRNAITTLTPKSSPNHSWNAVKLNGQWFLCDATWSAGRVFIAEDIPHFEFDYTDAYFLAPPQLFAKNHYPIDQHWLLLDNSWSFTDFLNGPLIYKGTYVAGVSPVLPKNMFLEIAQGQNITFKVRVHKQLDQNTLSLKTVKSGTENTYTPLVSKTKEGLVVSHVFKKKGLYDVHLISNNNIIATYVIKVLKSSSYP